MKHFLRSCFFVLLTVPGTYAQDPPAPTRDAPASIQGAAPSPTQDAAASKDSSSALTSAAWSALDRKEYAAAREAAERCRTLYGAQAVEMQGKLTTLPDKETAHQQWALNDVGTCVFVLGKAAEGEGKKEEAMAAYKEVVDKYPFAQCWDTQGWFWQPSVAARERMAFLTLENE